MLIRVPAFCEKQTSASLTPCSARLETNFFSPGNVDDRDEGVTGRLCREYIVGTVRTAVLAWDKTHNTTEKEYEKQVDGNEACPKN
jgi:hypothetical protein